MPVTRADAVRPLGSLFAPSSAAVIGASADPSKWGGLVAEKLLRGVESRAVYFVNHTGAEILGRPSYRTVTELPEVPEFAAITVPRAAFADAVGDALAKGVRAIVGMTAGFGETGEEGAALQRSIVDAVRAAGAVLLGPNCMGVYDSTAGFDCLPWAEPPIGSLGIISQSGSLIMDVAKRVHAYGLGVSRAASIGNQADVTIAELVTSMAEHDGTDVIAIYCEDVRDGQALFTAIEGAVASGTPVVILAPGASASASRAARSHTGAMLSDRRIIEAACRAAGAVLATSIREVAEAAQAVRSPLRGRGDRVAVVSDAGGFTVLGAVAANGEGLAVPVFSAALQERLAQLSLPGAGLKNPVDIVGLVTFDEFLPVLELILDSDEVDGVLANVSAFNSTAPEREHMLGARLADAAHASGKPLVVATPDGDLPGSQALRDRRIPVYPDIDVACRALRIACGEPPGGLPPVRGARPLPADADTYVGARRLLAEHALEFPPAEEVTDLPGALAAAERVGYPVVLKALGTLHKSDVGGVAVGLADQAALEEAFEDMAGRLQPPSCSVERSVDLSGGTEVIVGGRNDPRFGPVVLVGIGGVFSEVLADTAVALAPVDARHARSLIARLKGEALLTGARGRPAADLDALAAAIVSVSEVIATQPAIAELDVNPLIALPTGVLALDARIVRRA